MPHRGQGRAAAEVNASALRRCVEILLGDADFTQARFRSDCAWTARALAAAALYWAWSEARSLDERWRHARGLVASGFGIASLGVASQAFMRLLARWSGVLLGAVAASFRQRMEEDLGRRFRVAGFAPFAVDGTRHETPRTEANEAAFALDGARKRDRRMGKGSKAAAMKGSSPQINLAVLWHLALGLPWSWRRDGSGVGERTLLREMLGDLPAESLVVADAGFTGYDLWKAIVAAGHDLLVRVGGNVNLLADLDMTRARRGPKDRVWLWPEKGGGPPLELRLVRFGAGASTVWLVTTVLDKARLPDAALGELYRLRWGVEVFYRAGKQTFEKRKLRSRTPAHAYVELDWSLMGLWAVCLLALLEDPKAEPRRVSVAGLLKAVRAAMRDGSARPEEGRELFGMLKRARIDQYERGDKSSRDYPRKKREKPPGDPHIRTATQDERRRARKWFDLLELKA
jgi:hypothetical protein